LRLAVIRGEGTPRLIEESAGTLVEVEIERIGVLRSPVIGAEMPVAGRRL
jgi:hypothetical protein